MRLALLTLLLLGCDGAMLAPGPADAGTVFTSERERLAFTELSPGALPEPPRDVTNRHADDPAAAALGQKLFFTTLLSGALVDPDQNGGDGTLGQKGDTQKVACASCHVPEDFFSDGRSPSHQVSLAAGWGRRRAPSLLDAAQSKLLMWDGRHDAFYNQVFTPLESVVELNSSRLFAAQQVFAHFKAEYEAVFGALPPLGDTARFPPLSAALTGCQPRSTQPSLTCDGTVHGVPGDGAEFDGLSEADQVAVTRVVVNLGKAIEAYLRLLSCGPSRFDRWVSGDAAALSEAEQRGARLFIGKGNCSRCHSGAYLTDHEFHNVGLSPRVVASVFLDANDVGASAGVAASLADPLNSLSAYSDGDDGRLPAVVPPAWQGAFKTPSLRCVAKRPSLFHTGQVLNLDAAVAFFSKGGDAFGYPGNSELAPLELTDEERAELVAFLQALDGPGPAAGLMAAP
ncbi:MAG: hypothetical protein IPJ65_19015 [Archangiaceae bacterium]|nr:hypothetical protein [Archangiaceae bacterium]